MLTPDDKFVGLDGAGNTRAVERIKSIRNGGQHIYVVIRHFPGFLRTTYWRGHEDSDCHDSRYHRSQRGIWRRVGRNDSDRAVDWHGLFSDSYRVCHRGDGDDVELRDDTEAT